ncbi:carbohydrate kinase family protein [Anabaena sp. UHCC 0253]|uniref:carbohydrate kinase family protein n=1 Tax=Anabaena sp. UHCC 0253 TaxID=2590019 RepID=UPI00144848C9|nr:carbohydrate kinase family protein [Anabaena sp. UHCC 0253]MTJ55876.1 carbohydrate kinase family protein [Anabaena sp. UHCC 0253]
MFDLCAIGELVWLIILDIDSFPVSGETTLINKVKRLIGNDAAIVSVMASRMNLRTQLISNPISQKDGQILINFLNENGVDCSFIDTQFPYTPTTYCLREIEGQRTWLSELHSFPTEKIYSNNLKSNFFYIDLYEELIEDRLKLISYLLQNSNKKLFLNLSCGELNYKLSQVKNVENIKFIQLGLELDIEEALHYAENLYQQTFIQVIIITLAHQGSLALIKGKDVFISQCKKQVDQKGLIGAGATFSAAFIFAIQQGASYQKANQFAVDKATDFCLLKHNLLLI